MKNFWTVLKYTFLENIKKKTFLISTIILFFLTIVLFNIPNIAKSFEEDEKPNVPDTTEKQPIVVIDEKGKYDEYLDDYQIPETNYFFTVDEEATIDDLKKKLNDNKISSIIVIDSSKSVPTFKYIINNNSDLSVETIKQIIKNIHTTEVLSKYNVKDEDIASIDSEISYELQNVGEEISISLYFISIFGSLLLYLAIYFYGYSVSTSVSSEKTSRVMETLITSTKPSSIVLGKTAAMGLLGLLQLVFLIVTALLSYKLCVNGDFIIMGEKIDFGAVTPTMIILLVVYFILGYFLYAMLNALTGSTVSKAEDIQAAAMPVSFISLMSFYLGYFSLVTPESAMTKFASIFPFSSAFTMPSRMILTDVPVMEIILSVILLMLTIALLAYISIRIYSAAILYYGQRLKLKELFKMSKDN